MYVFSVNAKSRKKIDGFAADEMVPFIVYINFRDLFGAEQLCQLYLLRGDFYDISIEKRKMIADKFLINKEHVKADRALQEAVDTGYSVQLFEAH